MIKNKKLSVNKKAVAVGAFSLAAAAVGAYWLYGSKNATKHRKSVSSWMLKARAEVMDAVEKIKDLDKDSYLKIVDDVVSKYTKLSKSSAEVATIRKEMKSAWSHIRAATKPAKKAVKKIVSNVSKTVK